MQLRRRILPALLGVVVLAGTGLFAAYFFPQWVLPPLARWLDVGVNPCSADVILILPGDENARPFAAAALFQAGLAPLVLVPEAQTSPEIESGTVPETHEVTRRILERRGVPENRIVVLPGRSDSTFGDARALEEYLRDKPHARALVVTSDYHTRRASWIFSRVFRDRSDSLNFISAPSVNFSPDDWWKRSPGFTLITGEYLKLVYYRVRYAPIQSCAVLSALLTAAWGLRWATRRVYPHLARRLRALTKHDERSVSCQG